MAWQEIDPSKFNFATESAKVRKQADIARMLQEQGMQGTPGQFVRNGDFIGYSGETPLTAIASMLTSYLGKTADDKATAMQGDLNTNQQSSVMDVAKKLQRMNSKGVEAGSTMDDEYGTQPVYAPATAADKAGVYEQGLASGSPVAQMLIQGDMNRTAAMTAPPTYSEGDPNKDQYVTDGSGRRTLLKAGTAKQTELEQRVGMLMTANPNWTRQQAVAAATGALGIDPQSGLPVNKYDIFNGQQPAPATPQAAPIAAPQAQSAPAAPGAVPGRGQTFAGPGAAAPQTPAEFRQQQIAREQEAADAKRKVEAQERLDKNAPRIQEAQAAVVQIDNTLGKLNRIQELIQSDPTLIGPLNGNRTKLRAIGGDANATELLKLFDDLKMAKGRIDLKGQGSVTEWERKLSNATLPDIYTAGGDAVHALLGNLTGALTGERGTYATQLETYGAKLPEPKAKPAATGQRAPLVFH